MEKRYRQERERQERKSRMIGITLAVGVHILVCGVCSFSGFKYLYPPPQEQSILIEFEELKQPPVRVKAGRQPRAEQIDKSKPIKLVQASEAQHKGSKLNEAKEATIGPDGDVEVPEPPREKEIDRRALFSSANNAAQKDTLAAQTANKVSDALKEGHASGNTKKGTTTGEPNARLKGRNTIGTLPTPAYTVQNSGIVVVNIWVNQYGEVTKAIAGGEGTTITDKTLWIAARKAALKAHFNQSGDAPALQQGTITYIFNLK